MICPRCGDGAYRVIYAGFPMKLCKNGKCNCVWGFFSWVPSLMFNGWFAVFEGSYWRALWRWLVGTPEDD